MRRPVRLPAVAAALALPCLAYVAAGTAADAPAAELVAAASGTTPAGHPFIVPEGFTLTAK